MKPYVWPRLDAPESSSGAVGWGGWFMLRARGPEASIRVGGNEDSMVLEFVHIQRAMVRLPPAQKALSVAGTVRRNALSCAVPRHCRELSTQRT